MTSVIYQVEAKYNNHYNCDKDCSSCGAKGRCEGKTPSYSAGTYRCNHNSVFGGLCLHHLAVALYELYNTIPMYERNANGKTVEEAYYGEKVDYSHILFVKDNEFIVCRLPSADSCASCSFKSKFAYEKYNMDCYEGKPMDIEEWIIYCQELKEQWEEE